jgi:hypothetical protein
MEHQQLLILIKVLIFGKRFTCLFNLKSNAPYKLATDLGLKSHPALLTRGILFGYLTCVELDVAGSKTQMVAVVERESFPYPLVFSKEQIIGFNLVVKDTEFHINEYNQDSVEDKHYNLSGKWLELLHEKGITEKDLVPIADLPDCQDTFYKLSEQERAKLYRTKSFCYWYKGKKIWV